MIAGQARFSAACAKLPTARAASNRNGNGRRRRIIFGNSMTAESVQGRRRPVTRGYLRSRGVYCVCGEAQCHLQTASLGRGIVVEGQGDVVQLGDRCAQAAAVAAAGGATGGGNGRGS